MNVWVLYVKCKDAIGCIEDPSFPQFDYPSFQLGLEYQIVLSDHEDRAKRVLALLQKLK